ncbi:hypothetical protein [Mesorhizobium sp.]|uniref:hypothetical protein n=1 Tax=Mesorhizobium sp. TaxID=1871066 RepID=UPI0025B84F23|nr:hypothetical protein [Mesorhizobium sp.]
MGEIGLLALADALPFSQTAFDRIEAFRHPAERFALLFRVDYLVANADFIGLELQLCKLVIDPWLDDLLEFLLSGIEALRIPEAGEVGCRRLHVHIRRQEPGRDRFILKRVEQRLAPGLRSGRNGIVFAHVAAPHGLADSGAEFFRRHVEAGLLAGVGVGCAHVVKRLGQRAAIPILDSAFDSEIAFAAHIPFQVEAGFGQIGHDRPMHRRRTVSRAQQRVEPCLQLPHRLGPGRDAVVAEDWLFDGLSAHANGFRVRSYLFRRRDMPLKRALHRGEGGFPLSLGEERAGCRTEHPAKHKAAANSHCAFGQWPRLLCCLQHYFGSAGSETPSDSRTQPGLHHRPPHTQASHGLAARNERRKVQATGKHRGTGPPPSGGFDRAPVFVFHVDLRLHRFEGRAIENGHEPIGAGFVLRPLDRIPYLIARDAIARGNVDPGQLVRGHRADGVVLPECGAKQRRRVGRHFGFLLRLVVDGAECTESRPVFWVLQDRHQNLPPEPTPNPDRWLPS